MKNQFGEEQTQRTEVRRKKEPSPGAQRSGFAVSFITVHLPEIHKLSYLQSYVKYNHLAYVLTGREVLLGTRVQAVCPGFQRIANISLKVNLTHSQASKHAVPLPDIDSSGAYISLQSTHL